MRFLIIIILGLIGVAFAAPRQTERIVGGTDATAEEYPYIVNMQWDWFGVFYHTCGGALITTQSVLSASHCYEGYLASLYRAVLGATQTSGTDGTAYAVSRIILHASYNVDSVYNNDIAMVLLATPATLSNKVALASIAGPSYNIADGSTVTATGYGLLYFAGPQPSQLQQVHVATISQEICNDRYEVIAPITPGMLCAGLLDVGGQDACTGDSGGPLAHGPNKDIIVGVTSWGVGCADSYFPGVYARVSYYTDWILANAI